MREPAPRTAATGTAGARARAWKRAAGIPIVFFPSALSLPPPPTGSGRVHAFAGDHRSGRNPARNGDGDGVTDADAEECIVFDSEK